MKMKLIMEGWRRLSLTEEVNALSEKKENKMAKAKKELELIKKDPKAYIQQRTAKLQKKAGGAGGGEEGGGMGAAMAAQEKEQAQNEKELQQVDKLGDQAIAQAQKDPAQKPNLQKMKTADAAVSYIMDLVDEVFEKKRKTVQGLIKKDLAAAKKAFANLQSFHKWSDTFIKEAIEAFKKGKEDPKQYDEVIAMAAKYGFKPPKAEAPAPEEAKKQPEQPEQGKEAAAGQPAQQAQQQAKPEQA